MRSRLLDFSFPPGCSWCCLRLASRSRRPVTGEVHEIRPTSSGYAPLVDVPSGELVVVPALTRHWRQEDCSSHQATNLLRGVACHVRRKPTFFHVPSPVACWLRSGSYVHLAGSPAFTLRHMPAMRFRLPW